MYTNVSNDTNVSILIKCGMWQPIECFKDIEV